MTQDCEQAGYSLKKNRVYCRLFNYADVRARHAAGESVTAIAKDLGVAWGTVKRVVDAEYAARLDERSQEWMRENYREPCKGGCGRLVWMVGKGAAESRTGYCRSCLGLIRCDTAKPGLLRCADCGEWKPDEAFPMRRRAVARRQRATQCRPCSTAARQAYRERNKVPCSRCGKPCLAPNERVRHDGRIAEPTDLCSACWQETVLVTLQPRAVQASAVARRDGG